MLRTSINSTKIGTAFPTSDVTKALTYVTFALNLLNWEDLNGIAFKCPRYLNSRITGSENYMAAQALRIVDILRRRHPKLLAKTGGKIGRILKSHVIGNFGHRSRMLRQQLRRAFESQNQHKLRRR